MAADAFQASETGSASPNPYGPRQRLRLRRPRPRRGPSPEDRRLRRAGLRGRRPRRLHPHLRRRARGQDPGGAGGAVLPGAFADLTGVVDTAGERGLLSIAFPPDFQSSRLLYAYYADGDGDIHVDELRAPSGDRADPGYRRVTVEIPTSSGNHKGGTAAFGPDGYLYLAPGDGTDSGNAQSGSSLLGKVLRIAPRRGGGYAIPSSNPGASPIWARGLRNPFRLSFDRVTGDLVIGDVGASTVEEINFAPASANRGRGWNYGWPTCEGATSPAAPATPARSESARCWTSSSPTGPRSTPAWWCATRRCPRSSAASSTATPPPGGSTRPPAAAAGERRPLAGVRARGRGRDRRGRRRLRLRGVAQRRRLPLRGELHRDPLPPAPAFADGSRRGCGSGSPGASACASAAGRSATPAVARPAAWRCRAA